MIAELLKVTYIIMFQVFYYYIVRNFRIHVQLCIGKLNEKLMDDRSIKNVSGSFNY